MRRPEPPMRSPEASCKRQPEEPTRCRRRIDCARPPIDKTDAGIQSLRAPARLSARARPQGDVAVVPDGGHRKVKAVDRQRQLDVARSETWPLAGHELAIALALLERLQEPTEVDAV